MIRQVIARSVVIAGLFAIFGIFYHWYGIESLPLGASVTSFPAALDRIHIAGELRSGLRAGAYHRLKFDGKTAQVLRLNSEDSSDKLSLYVGRRYLETGQLVVTVDQSLLLSAQKDFNAGYETISYSVDLVRVPITEADHVAVNGDVAVIHAIWTEQSDKGILKVRLKGAQGETGNATIMIPIRLPVIGGTSPASAVPMVVSAEPNSPQQRDFKICLSDTLLDPGFDVLPLDERAFRWQDFYEVIDLALAGDGVEVSMRPDMNPTRDSSSTQGSPMESIPVRAHECIYPGSVWSSLPESEKLAQYRRKLSTIGTLETFLLARRTTAR